MTSGLAIREVRTTEELEALAPAWWALWRRAPQATPFQAPAWLIPWWRSFQPGELQTIAVEADGRLVALAPLYLETGPLGRRLLPVGISLSDYLDVLLDPDVAPDAGAAIMAHLAGAEWPWEVLELQELAPGAAALALPVAAGLEETSAGQSACPVLTLPGGVEGLAECIPARQRRKLRMARNRAERLGGVDIVRADGNSSQAFLQALFDLHRARWRSRGASGVLDSAEVRRFHRAAIGGLAEAGLARLYEVRSEGRTIGAYYGLVHGGRALAYLTGFDPAYERISPGTLLVGHAIAEAVREGAREFHFLRGQETYKYGWSAADRWNRRRLFRRAPAP
jgi:CelD/BcsL family acetyltransferase involved in cellulose biosynthesis